MKPALDDLAAKIPDFAKDIRLNLKNTLDPQEENGLSKHQRAGIAVSVALALDNVTFARSLTEVAGALLTPEDVEGVKKAVAIMASNNVYYRSVHLIEDPELSKAAARLRMNVIANPGIDKADFELYCTAVSAVAGCSLCLQSHVRQLKGHGFSQESVQDVLRLTSSVVAAHRALITSGL